MTANGLLTHFFGIGMPSTGSMPLISNMCAIGLLVSSVHDGDGVWQRQEGGGAKEKARSIHTTNLKSLAILHSNQQKGK